MSRRQTRGFPDGLLLVILIVVGAALGRMQTLARDHGRIDPLEFALLELITPIAKPLSRGLLSMQEFGSGMLRARSLALQNEALKAQLVSNNAYAERVDFLEQQLDDDRKQFGMPSLKRTRINLDVIGISLSDGSLILDGGAELGIRPDLPVVNGDGLVGIVRTVTKGECQVSLLSAYGLKIFAVDSSRTPPEEGLLQGTGEPTLTMRMLDSRYPVASGDTILTSLKSKNIPSGLVVGRVIKVEDDLSYGTKRLTVDPAVNLGVIGHVQVLK